jgi:hypothetical protein
MVEGAVGKADFGTGQETAGDAELERAQPKRTVARGTGGRDFMKHYKAPW